MLFFKYHNMQIRQCFERLWGYSMNANEKVLAGNADARYPDADNNAT